MPESIKISVAIPTYNRGIVLLNTIEQLFCQSHTPCEIIIIDQSSWYPEGVQRTLEKLSEEGKIHYLRQDFPSLPQARNSALSLTTSDILVFIDDDVILHEHFVKAHLDCYVDTSVWSVCGRTVDLREPKTNVSPFNNWPKVYDYLYFNLSSGTPINDFGNLMGCNHSVRVNCILELGGYDINFLGVSLREDTDLALRVIRKGGRIIFSPLAHLHHLGVPAGGCRLAEWGGWSAGECNLRFIIKHQDTLRQVFWKEVWRSYRLAVLNRKNLRSPFDLFHYTSKFLLMFASFSLARFLGDKQLSPDTTAFSLHTSYVSD